MAILPFLAAGQTHKNKGLYSKQIAQGLAWLIKEQKPSGDLSGLADPTNPNGKGMYAHTIATLALCEAYGMTKDDPKTRDEALGSAARKAVAYLARAQNEATGGWRYTPNYESDTSVFGWAIMALKSAQLANIPVDSAVFDRAQIWLNAVAKGTHMGLYSYRPYIEVTPTMTAVGMLCRQYMGVDPKSPSLLEGKAYLLENMPGRRPKSSNSTPRPTSTRCSTPASRTTISSGPSRPFGCFRPGGTTRPTPRAATR